VDVSLVGRALWRHKWLTILSIVLAAVLGALSIATVHFGGRHSISLSYRGSEKWTSTSSVWVTQKGFPLGRTTLDSSKGSGPLLDPNSLAGRATVYASLVSSDGVRDIMKKNGGAYGTVVGTQQTTNGGNILLPFVTIAGTAKTPGAARVLTERATNALREFVAVQQAANQIPYSRRVVLQAVQHAGPAVLIDSRSKTRPVAVGLAALLVCFGLILLLETRRQSAQREAEGAATLPPPLPAEAPATVAAATPVASTAMPPSVRRPRPAVGQVQEVLAEPDDPEPADALGYGWSSQSV
jgi:hypothetical protein